MTNKDTKEEVEQTVEEAVEAQTTEVENPTEEAEEAAPEETEEDVLLKLEAERDELRDKVLRQQAEFENYRKRTIREKADLYKTAGEKIFLDMLPLVDDFERAEKAMAASEDVEALRAGMDLIYKKFLAFLEKNEVRPIAAEKGDDFNVDNHEAITLFQAGEELKGKIVDCTQQGYTLGDKVIRYAKVVVGE